MIPGRSTRPGATFTTPVRLIDETVEEYKRRFRVAPEIVVSAPGRVNLIGEHTDYNDGYVLPVAVEQRIAVAAGPSPSDELRLFASDLQSEVTLQPRSLARSTSAGWTNYPAGIADILQRECGITASDTLCVHGNIPMGAGMSSSAALAVACTAALRKLHRLELSDRDLITIARRAEVEFAGVECGIMDQFISVMARERSALFLDCRTLQYEHVPLPASMSVLVCDTGVSRRLAHSEYNRRRDECREAVRQLAEIYPGTSALRDVSLEQFRRVEEHLTEIPRKRARHVISENERVLRCVAAFRKGDAEGAGRWMTESHASLRDDYEVSCAELDAFVASALRAPGVFGARMTGAGFGGCAICIVDRASVHEAMHEIGRSYAAAVGKPPDLFTITPSAGLSESDQISPGT